MRSVDLNPAQRYALECLDSAAPSYDGVGVVISSGLTGLYDRQAFIHYQTAEALERRGLVRLTHEGEWTSIRRRGPRPSRDVTPGHAESR